MANRISGGWGAKIGLWFALVVLFLVFFNWFNTASPAPDPTVEERASMSWMPFAGLLVGLFAVVFPIFYWRARRWMQLNNRAVAHLNAGDPDQAARLFEQAVPKGLNRLQRAVSVFNLAMARFLQGRLEEAASLLREVDASRGLRQLGAHHQALPNHLAACYALLGDVGAARTQLQEGERRRGQDPSNFALLPEVIVLCREGHFGAAVKTLDDRWREAEVMGARYVKLLRVLRAYALDAVDPAANESAVGEALAGARPLAPHELDVLVAGWPKLRDFLVARQVMAAA